MAEEQEAEEREPIGTRAAGQMVAVNSFFFYTFLWIFVNTFTEFKRRKMSLLGADVQNVCTMWELILSRSFLLIDTSSHWIRAHSLITRDTRRE